MSVWHCLSLPLVLASLGCTVAAVSGQEDTRPKNSCQNGCGRGESCVDGLCQSLNGELESVLVTATPALGSSLPNLTFVTNLEDAQLTGGVRDIVWPGPVRVSGSLVLPTGHCYPEFISEDPSSAILPSKDGTLPLTATLTLKQRWLGLPQTYIGKTNAAPLNGYAFALDAPSGEYDVYLVPPKGQQGRCVVPPQLFRRVPIGVGDNATNGEYRFKLAAVTEMDLHLVLPTSSPSLVGWTADIIESLAGNRISTEVVLTTPDSTRGLLDYAAALSYSAVTEQAEDSNVDSNLEILRLRPPSELVAPTIYLERSVIGLLQDPGKPVNVTTFKQFPPPVTVGGLMTSKVDGVTQTGTVTFVSQTIYGVDPGVFASFQTSVDVGSDGLLNVVLPPGKYLVRAEPPVASGSDEDSLSILQAEWDIPADIPVQFGKLLELSPMAQVKGQSLALGARVQVAPLTPFVARFDQVFGDKPFGPRSTGGFVDEGGRFALEVDDLLGTRANFTVVGPEGLGFGWFVHAGLELGKGVQDLGRVTLPIPAVIAGTASVTQNGANVALGSATIRAYAYLDDAFERTRVPEEAMTIVQVAETRADATGAFRLLVPATIQDASK